MKKPDGFGSQYQGIITTYLFCKMKNLNYLYTPLSYVEHNYNNDENFLEKLEFLMNVKNNIPNNNLLTQEINIKDAYSHFENNIDECCNNEHFDFIKECFWKNKDKNYYKNNKINISVHIRKLNIVDSKVENYNSKRYAPLSYFFDIMTQIRNKYKGKELLFHIYSQGDVSEFREIIDNDVQMHLNEDIVQTFIGLVASDILITSVSSLSYVAGLLTDGEVYYLNFWHPPRKHWIINDIKSYHNMKICFYNLNHIGDVYFNSFFIKMICKQNPNMFFYYFSILGDVFFENIKNIKRIYYDIENNYKNKINNGDPPEQLLDKELLNVLLNCKMENIKYKILKINGEKIVFINTWSSALSYTDYDIIGAQKPFYNLINEVNTNTNLNIIFNLKGSNDFIEIMDNDADYYKNIITEKYENHFFDETVFIFNYVPRSLNFDMNILNQFIEKLSQTTKIILANYNNIFENNSNITFLDRHYNILPEPSCRNLIKIWEIAIKCSKVILLPTGSAWTFFHKIKEIKENQLFIIEYGNKYYNLLNQNNKYLLNTDKTIIHSFMI